MDSLGKVQSSRATDRKRAVNVQLTIELVAIFRLASDEDIHVIRDATAEYKRDEWRPVWSFS